MSTLNSYAVITSDKHGTILSVNRIAMQLFGYSQEELVGKKVNILMPPPYSEQHDTYLARYHTTREAHIIGSSRGVTAIKKSGELMELNLAISEAETVRGTLYIAMFEKARDRRVIIDIDREGKIYGLKGNLFLTFGYHKDELVGNNIAQLFPPFEEGESVMKLFELENGFSRLRQVTGLHKIRGETATLSLYVSKASLRIRLPEGGVEEIPGFRTILTPIDNMEAMVTLSRWGVVLAASPEFHHLFGYTKKEVMGHPISRLIKGELRDVFDKKEGLTEGLLRRNIIGLHKDGSVFTAEIEMSKTVVGDEADSPSMDDQSFVCKIVRASSKKQDKDLIPEGEYMGMYQYGKILGSGYFGKVRMAYHRITKEKVAIKTLRKKQYLSVNMEYPPREIAVLKAVDHPNINRLYDTVVLEDRIHLILEYVEGRELCEIVETETIPEEVCRHLWRHILLAVDHLHENGIVHRDLKLENIIISRSGDVKVIDLGFGNFVHHDNHLLRTFCGSPDYAAPELFMGKAYNGKHADIWSLGVLLYAMLSGLLPFKNNNLIMRGKYQFPATISAKAQNLISGILQVDPEKRMTVKEMMAHPWTSIGYSGPPQQPPSLFDTAPDDAILSEMTTHGMSVTTVRNSLLKREFNQFTTIYFLLQKKKAREEFYKGLPPSEGGIPIPSGSSLTPRGRRARRRSSKEECLLV